MLRVEADAFDESEAGEDAAAAFFTKMRDQNAAPTPDDDET